MSTRVFFLNTLRPGARPEDYERFVREVDYPTARRIPSIEHYEVVRIAGGVAAGLPCDYLEIVSVHDLERYRADLETLPGRESFLAELRRFVGDAVVLDGTVIE